MARPEAPALVLWFATTMNRAVLNSMTEVEQLLVHEASREAMAELDEEELLGLHERIRRARSKYVTNSRGVAT
jgi:hypothetical protein